MKAAYVNSNGDTLKMWGAGSCREIIFQSIKRETPINVYSNKGVMQDGVSYQGNTLGVEDITLKFAIKGMSPEHSQRQRDMINKVFSPKRGLGTLKYKGRQINTICTSLPYFSENVGDSFYEVLVNLEAVDPYWVDADMESMDLADWEAMFHFPLIIPEDEGIIFGLRTTSTIIDAANRGHVPTGLIIRLKAAGDLKNPSLHNLENGQKMKLNINMNSGDEIIINTNYGQKSIVDKEGNNLINTLDIAGGNDQFIVLEVGSNDIKYDADEGLDMLNVSIQYHNKYLGV